jgi:phosphoglycolate phosphatase
MNDLSQNLFLFDIDGTLLTSNRSGYRSFVRACRQVLGIMGEVDGVLMAGKLDRVIFEEIAARFRPGLDSPGIDELWMEFKTLYVGFLRRESVGAAGWTLMPGVRELLEFCSGLGRLALLTGNVVEGARIKLATLGVDSYFPTGGFGEEPVTRSRLAEVALDEARRYYHADFPPRRTFVLGDTVRDIEAGRAIGAHTVAVATGTVSFETLAAAGAELTVRDFASEADRVRRFLSAAAA